MPPKKRSSITHRIERSEDLDIHDDSEHLWAVSYADVLMVLLSFFILFYSNSEQAKDTIIQQIVEKTSAGGSETKLENTAPTSSTKNTDSENTNKGVALDGLQKELQGLNPLLAPDKKTLRLDFADNIYANGKIHLTGEHIKTLLNVLNKLESFKNKIHITFVGYTDAKLFKNTTQSEVKANLDLGALRASRATQLASNLGFDMSLMAAKAVISPNRSTRSLSIEIRTAPNLEAKINRTTAAIVKEYYTVQVKASTSEESAYEYAAKLVHHKNIKIIPAKIKGNTWYRVFVGKKHKLADIKSLQKKLITELNNNKLFIKKITP